MNQKTQTRKPNPNRDALDRAYDAKRGTAWTAYRPPSEQAERIRGMILDLATLHGGLSAAMVDAIEKEHRRKFKNKYP